MSGTSQFMAYNFVNGRLVMTGAHARQILNHIRDHLWPSVDGNSVEISTVVRVARTLK